MKKMKIFKLVVYLILIISISCLVTSIILKLNNYYILALAIIVGLLIGLLVYSSISMKREEKIHWLENRVKLTNSIAYRIKLAGEKCFTEIPLGIIVYDNTYTIEWANNYAKEIFLSPLVDRKFAYVDKELEAKVKAVKDFKMSLYGHQYDVSILREDNILFITDRTELHNLEKRYFDHTQAAGIINLDNFEEALSSIDAQERAMRISDIIGILSDWCEKFDVYIRGYSEKQYLILMDREQLDKLINDQFSVIDNVNDYCAKESLKISISMGVACFDSPINKLMEKTYEMLDLALNRGGNQGVVIVDNTIKYFGGKEKGADTRLPVYVRVKTEDLCELISKSSNVLIMSHLNADADAFGASIALFKICKTLDKEAKIVLDDFACDITVKDVYKEVKEAHIGMIDYFVKPDDALYMFDNKTLLVLVDCQYEGLLVSNKVYKKANNIAIIDHHRSNSSAISNPVYLYNKTSASSSVEMIVEMFDYIDEEIELSSIEATLMLLGIIVDTNNLIYRASAQTFNVLSKLQTYGANMSKVHKFLREDFDIYSKRVKILNTAEIIDNKYAIAVCDDMVYTRQFIAKIADNILTVSTVLAGFCIGYIGEGVVAVSARSYDEYNVQLIMEEFGGGGHFNNAAAQIRKTTIEEVKNRLLGILKVSKEDKEDTMKIILIKDVKGKGKSGDIIDIPAGHANYLIKQKQAIIASIDNLNECKRRSEQEKIDAQNLLEEMRKQKVFLENNPISIDVRVGKEGKLFGSISTKQIVDEIKDKYNVVLDKRKIVYNKEIDSLGTYKIPIQLHKEVIAEITLYVVEKK